MKWSKRILVLLAIASALVRMPDGARAVCAAEAGLLAPPELWMDGSVHDGSRIRSVVATVLGYPSDDFLVPSKCETPIWVTPRLSSGQPAAAGKDLLWSPTRSALARHAGGTLVAGVLGMPVEQLTKSQGSRAPLGNSGGWGPDAPSSGSIPGQSPPALGVAEATRNSVRNLTATIMGMPTDQSPPASVASVAADGSFFTALPSFTDTSGEFPSPSDDAAWETLQQPWYSTPAAPPFGRQSAVRLGWWGVTADGDVTTLGEFQDLRSSPFVDVDQLSSDGVRTWDMFATFVDDKATQAAIHFYGPELTADVEYQHFYRRLVHDPLSNFSAPGSGDVLVAEDVNAGEDYAFRLQELKTNLHGKLTKRLKYRVDFRLLRKSGDRQAIGSQHCAGGNMFGSNANATCHVLSQTQRIDWVTLAVEPIIEGKWGPLTVEYSRPMRSFGQSDQIVTRQYGDFSVYDFSGQHPYAFVPENFKQTDRLKMGVQLTDRTRLYSKMLTSNVQNKFRNTNRRAYDVDLRLTNQATSRLTLTGYGWTNIQKSEFPPFFVDPEGQAMSPTYVSMFGGGIEPQLSSIVPRYGLRHPLDYSRYALGAEASWKPEWWTDLARGLSFVAGCETGATHRKYADYFIEQSATVFDQRRTSYISYFITAKMGWSPTFNTFVRYKGRHNNNPLYGVDQITGITNTNLPELEQLVEIGGAWAPAPQFIANVNAGIQNRSHSSSAAEFEEDNYPVTISLQYAPTYDLTFNAGYGTYSNWIDQDVWLPGDNPAVDRWDRMTWSYGGRSRILSLGAGYAWTPRITLSGGVEFVWARNIVDPLQPWPDLPEYFDVIVNTTRINTGIDFWVRDGISGYFRYVFGDYEDKSVDYNSGTAHLFLVGATVVY